jgi:hypothetical protein
LNNKPWRLVKRPGFGRLAWSAAGRERYVIAPQDMSIRPPLNMEN